MKIFFSALYILLNALSPLYRRIYDSAAPRRIVFASLAFLPANIRSNTYTIHVA